ncbi:hypothetical protein E4U43_001193 [Claviceps pusilla]|uniref:NAD-dependent epimerase/dehydratase domain-containing protein n=1 Tax=Claviceps pusilla TaxID=123648 RepID=A0A9P7SZD2_9HYPO|nr:hypothetical protein E4U43_001193 [Claviceps pusilla]
MSILVLYNYPLLTTDAIKSATGMVGFKTLMVLLKRGHLVRAAVRTQAGFDRIRSLECIRGYTSQLSSIVVPDNTVPGAYDEAVRGATFVIHVASPVSAGTSKTEAELRESMIRPAVQGTIGLLTAAKKTGNVERVVITGSLASIASRDRMASGEVIDENTLDVDTDCPLQPSNAYSVSKALALTAIKDFVQLESPNFTVINIFPVFVLGRDDSVTDVETIARKGTNSLLLRPLLGIRQDIPLGGSTVHIDDVAEMHVRALDDSIRGNEDFIAAAGPMEWADSFDIVKRRFPKEYGEGVFAFDDAVRPVTSTINADNSKARRMLGMEFKSFEEQVVSLVGHYLELRGSVKNG